MTDPQTAMLAAAIPAGASALGLLIRSAATIVRDSRILSATILRDSRIETTKRWEDALKESNAVIRENSQAFADLRQALGVVDTRTQDVGRRVVEIHRETSDVYHTEPTPPQPDVFDPYAPGYDDTPVQVPRAPTRERTGRTPPQGAPVASIGGPTQPRPASSPYSFVKPSRKDG